jgi:hypothetical protein
MKSSKNLIYFTSLGLVLFETSYTRKAPLSVPIKQHLPVSETARETGLSVIVTSERSY